MGYRIFEEFRYIMITDRIELDTFTSTSKFSSSYSYKDVDKKFISEFKENKKIRCIQISKDLPDAALRVADKLLAERPDVVFRLFGMRDKSPFDLARILEMSSLKKLELDILVKSGYQRFVNLQEIAKIEELDTLRLDVFGNVDLGFLQQMTQLKHFYLLIQSGKIRIEDSFWETQCFHSLRLGKKAVPYVYQIKDNSSIQRLVLFQTKLNDYSFLKNIHMKELYLINCVLENTGSIEPNSDIEKLILADCKTDSEFWDKFGNLQEFTGPISLYSLNQHDI